MTLGEQLRHLRLTMGLSQRAVEEKTGISNAFLSQLESGKVKQPSPLALHKLSDLYGIEYDILMDLAGYPVPKTHRTGDRVFGRLGKVTPDEENELERYLAFIRNRQQGRRARG